MNTRMHFWALLVIAACLTASQKMNNQSIKAVWASIDQHLMNTTAATTTDPRYLDRAALFVLPTNLNC